MGKQNDASAIDPLIAVLNNEDPKLLVAAVEALGNLGDSKAVKPLEGLTRHRSASVRKAVAKALGSFGGSRAIQPLTSLLGDRHHDVFEQAGSTRTKSNDPIPVRIINPMRTLQLVQSKLIGWKIGHIRPFTAM